MTDQHSPPISSLIGTNRYSAAELVRLVATAGAARHATLDEQYTVTAVMIEQAALDGSTQDVLVELMETDTHDRPRWTAAAYDHLRDIHIGPSSAAEPARALALLPWQQLDAFTQEPPEPDQTPHPGRR